MLAMCILMLYFKIIKNRKFANYLKNICIFAAYYGSNFWTRIPTGIVRQRADNQQEASLSAGCDSAICQGDKHDEKYEQCA